MSNTSKNPIGWGTALAALIIVGGGVLAAVLLLNNRSNRPSATPGTGTQRVVSAATLPAENKNLPNAITIDPNATQLVEVGAAYCVALVPDGWNFTSAAPYTSADIFSPDKHIHAAWTIASISKAQYPTEEDALNSVMNSMFPGFTAISPKPDSGNGFFTLEFTTGAGQKGQLFYILYDVDPNNFVISIYMAETDTDQWTSQGVVAISSAISIRCVTQMRPSTGSLDLGAANPSDPNANPEVILSANWTQAIMGYINVYSPALGEHYLVRVDSLWADGPAGSGYYRQLPEGGYELLVDGFGEY